MCMITYGRVYIRIRTRAGVRMFPSLDSCWENVLASVLLALWDWSFIPTSNLLTSLIFHLWAAHRPLPSWHLHPWPLCLGQPRLFPGVWARQKASTLCLCFVFIFRSFFSIKLIPYKSRLRELFGRLERWLPGWNVFWVSVKTWAQIPKVIEKPDAPMHLRSQHWGAEGRGSWVWPKQQALEQPMRDPISKVR